MAKTKIAGEKSMDTCVANSHRIEYVEDLGGLTWWRCLDCGEVRPVYTDTQGG
jgi:hypothetical protein